MSNFIVSRQVYDTHKILNNRTSPEDRYEFNIYPPFAKSTKIGKKMVFKEFHLWQNDTAAASKWKRAFYFVEAPPACPSFQVRSKVASGPIANKLGQDPAVLVFDEYDIKINPTEFYMYIEDVNQSTIIPTFAPSPQYGDLSHAFRIVIDYYY